MSKFKSKRKNIFCIEGDWETDLRKSKSVLGVLEFLKSISKIDFIHRNCSTKIEFINRLEQFKKYSSYSILYLAFHGSSNTIHLGDETINLNEIQEILKDKLENKIIYFGSCQTLKTSNINLSKFIEVTKASCLVGFAKDVLNKEKTITQVNKEIDAIKGFSEKQKTGIKNSVALRVKFPDVDKVLFDVKFTTDYTKKAEMLINSYPDNDLTDQSPESKKIIAQIIKIGGINFPKAKYIQLLKDKKENK